MACLISVVVAGILVGRFGKKLSFSKGDAVAIVNKKEMFFVRSGVQAHCLWGKYVFM